MPPQRQTPAPALQRAPALRKSASAPKERQRCERAPAQQAGASAANERPGDRPPALSSYFFGVVVVPVVVVVFGTAFVTSVALYSTRVPG